MKEDFSFEETVLGGAYLIRPLYSADERGALLKDYHIDIFRANGLTLELKETFYTISRKGVLRAIHFQEVKQQAKLVRCIKGAIYDVIVDLRPDSPSYKKWAGFELSEYNRLELYVPEHFGHGYLVLEDSIVSYKCNEIFHPEYDTGIRWDDPEIDVKWPVELIGGYPSLIISEKDRNLLTLSEYLKGNPEG